MTKETKTKIKRLLTRYKFVQYISYTETTCKVRIIGRTGRLVYGEPYRRGAAGYKLGICEFSTGCTQRKTLEGTLRAVAEYEKNAGVIYEYVVGLRL